jgi:hypothetical protein
MVPKCRPIAVLKEAMAARTPLISLLRLGFDFLGALGQIYSMQDFLRIQFASRKAFV